VDYFHSLVYYLKYKIKSKKQEKGKPYNLLWALSLNYPLIPVVLLAINLSWAPKFTCYVFTFISTYTHILLKFCSRTLSVSYISSVTRSHV